MKKTLILACAALTACTNDIDLGPNKEQVETLSNAIGFQMAKKNMTTTKAAQTLQSQGHYNFGVWGYKASTGVGEPLIMENYLVGFGGDNVGYLMDASKQTTWGGNTYNDDGTYTDGKSQWAYENMGTSQYFNMTDVNYYRSDAPQKTYLSNNTEQFLRYWDLSSARTAFYAYAPYVNSTTAPVVTFTENTGSNSKLMTFSARTIKMGTDASQNEFMYAVNKVKNADYKNDVKLQFHRLNSRVQIKFWENIPGYKVKIVALNTNQAGTTSYDKDVYAKPAIAPITSAAPYRVGKYLVDAGAKITFSNDERETAAVSSDVEYTDPQYSSDFFTFDMPNGDIGEIRADATSSNTTYYMVPNKGNFGTTALNPDIENTGYTFHVSYQLTAEGTGEVITVTDARVYVPAANCEWAPNKSYTYIFKITKSSNGTTDKKDPKPDEVDIPTDHSLFPIVFDGCTVVDYETEIEKDYTISENAHVYTLSLNASSVAKGGSPITGTANAASSTSTTAPTSSDIAVEKVTATGDPNKINVTVNTGTTNNISISAAVDAPAGTYKLIYKKGSEVVATVTFTVTD